MTLGALLPAQPLLDATVAEWIRVMGIRALAGNFDVAAWGRRGRQRANDV